MNSNLSGCRPVENFSDEELALEAQGGSSAAFEALADRHRQMLLRHVQFRVRCRHEAEDIVQDTLLRVSRNLHRYDSGRPFLPWLLTVATRLAISHKRRRVIASANLEHGFERSDSRDGPLEQVSQAEMTVRLWQAIEDHLSPRQYQVLWLRYAEGCSVAEVAARSRLTRLHVKVLLHRARRQLLKCGCIRRLIAPA